MFHYFLLKKSDAHRVLQEFLADVALLGSQRLWGWIEVVNSCQMLRGYYLIESGMKCQRRKRHDKIELWNAPGGQHSNGMVPDAWWQATKVSVDCHCSLKQLHRELLMRCPRDPNLMSRTCILLVPCATYLMRSRRRRSLTPMPEREFLSAMISHSHLTWSTSLMSTKWWDPTMWR